MDWKNPWNTSMKRASQMGRGCKQVVSHASYFTGSDCSFWVPFSINGISTFQPGTSLGRMTGLNRNGWISDHRHISEKMKKKEISHPQKWDRWPGDNWQAEGWGANILFVSIFTGSCSSHISWDPKPQGWGEWRVQGWVWAHCATPTPFSSMPALLLRKVFFWSMINCPGCVPFQCLCHPQAPDWGREEALALCKHCSTTDKTLVWYQCYSRHKSKTHHHMGCWREYQPHLSQTTSNLFRSSV